MKTTPPIFSLPLLLLLLLLHGHAGEAVGPDPYQCGKQGGGRKCPEGLCCSKWGWCGTSDAYCGENNCQSQCPGLSSIIPESLFEEFLKYRNDRRCNGRGFYTYEAFLGAAKDYPEFGNAGNETTRKREIAAFFGHTSVATTGGWATADGRYASGYCRKVMGNTSNTYCRRSVQWPCAPGKKYYGRGPMQAFWNDNYGRYGEGLGLDLLNNPDLVENDPVISFKTAIWLWMTPRAGRPSSHDVMIGKWVPSEIDIEAGRLPGFGTTINVITPTQCGRPYPDWWSETAIGYYKRYCDIYGIDYGDNIDCYNQRSYRSDPNLASI